MGDAITITLILTLAAVVPLLVNFFTDANESIPPDGPPEFDDDGHNDNFTPSDDWPSIIDVTGLETAPKAYFESEHVGADLHCKV